MQVVYICEDYCTIHRCLDHLVARKNGRKLESIPLVNVSCLVVFSHVQLTSQCLVYLFRRGIDVVFISNSGWIRGRLMAEKANNILIRIAQHEKWRDRGFGLAFSRCNIGRKLDNQISLLRMHQGNGVHGLENALARLTQFKEQVASKASISELMGIEGLCARIYFGTFPLLLKCDIPFPGRTGRAASDPINALMNLSYAFLCNELTTRLHICSIETDLGFMHGLRYGRQSLALDLMEEFRPLFADRFVLSLFNRKMICSDDFEPGEYSLLLKKDMLKQYVVWYQERLNGIAPINHGTDDPSGKKTWSSVFNHCIRDFRNQLLDAQEPEGSPEDDFTPSG